MFKIKQRKRHIMADFERVSLRTKVGYGAGHIMNDMCASMWFTYLLLFFHKVLEFDNDLSGTNIFLPYKPKCTFLNFSKYNSFSYI